MKTILVPIDGSSLSETALAVAFAIARRRGAAGIETVTVTPPLMDPLRTSGAPVRDTRLDHDRQAWDKALVETLGERLVAMSGGIPTKATLLEGDAAERIAEQLRGGAYEMVVMTTHGRSGASRMWLGSVADRVVRMSPVPVLLLRDVSSTSPLDDEPLFRDVLVPIATYEEYDESELILSDALALAGDQATYHLLNVVSRNYLIPPPSAIDVATASAAARAYTPPADTLDATREAATRALGELARRLGERGVHVTTRVVEHGNPAEAILDHAHAIDARLIAMASHGRGPVRRALLGSVTDKVVRGAAIPVLVFVP